MKKVGLLIIVLVLQLTVAPALSAGKGQPASENSDTTAGKLTTTVAVLDNLSQSPEQHCVDCHANAATISLAGTHSELSCSACHEQHSGEPRSAMQYGLKSCTASCHGRHDLGLSHPMGDDLQNRTGVTLTCVSTCHSIHQPHFEHLLVAEGSDVCEGCHTEKF